MEAPRKLASGRYQARAFIDGKRVSLGTYRNQKQAERVQMEFIVKPEKALEARGGERFELFAERHLRTRQHALGRGTWVNYQRMLAKWIVPTFGSKRLRDIRPADVDDWFNRLPKTPQRRLIYFLMHSIMRKAVKQGEILMNPCQVEGVTAIQSKKRRTWTLDDFHMLVRAAHNDQERALLWTLLGAGVRIGEALAMNWEDIDLATGAVTISKHLTRFGMQEGTKHHDDQERTLTIPPKAVDALQRHSDAALRFPDEPVFVNTKGARLSYHAAFSRFDALRRSVALDELKPHDLRHLSLTLYAQQGPTMKELMDRGGHTDHRSALTYQHTSRERDRAIAIAMDAVL